MSSRSVRLNSERSTKWLAIIRVNKTSGILLTLGLLLISAHYLPAPVFELAERLPQTSGTVLNTDGSKTTYDIDRPHRKATAVVTNRDGKLRQRIEYELDAAGHIMTKNVFDASGNRREKISYKYDKVGRVMEQTQLGKDENVVTRIAYVYDQQTGKQSGYSIYDANGRLVSESGTVGPSRSPAKPAFGEGPPGG